MVIEQALTSDPVDTRTLREAAASNGGLLNDSVRRRRQVRENHKDLNQVQMDVRRSVRRFPKGMRVEEREVLQQQMIDSILEVLRRNPQLHYYQGYHDIVVTFLLVVGERPAIAIVEKLSNHHLRDFMDPTMDSTKHILNYLMPILEQAHPQLHGFMLRAEVGTIFALSWLITWYSLSELRLILRLYDFFLASHPLMPIYYAAAIVLHREEEVLREECDMAMVHHLLSCLPKDLPYQQLIGQAQKLISQYPPSFLAQRAALQYRNSITISSFQSFQLSTLHQRPDSVLRLQSSRSSRVPGGRRQGAQDTEPVSGQASRMVRVAVWGLSATLGAAVLAVAQTALDWTPDLLMQLF
ncbi:TBC1 domain family member 20 [Aplochiton taeniatus]